MSDAPVLPRKAALQLLRTMHGALTLVRSGLDVLAPRGDPEAIDLIAALRARVDTVFGRLEAEAERAASCPSEGESGV